MPALRRADARGRRHRRDELDGGDDARRAGHVHDHPARRGRISRLDRLHRGEPLPRRALRVGARDASGHAVRGRRGAARRRGGAHLRHLLRLRGAALHGRLHPRGVGGGRGPGDRDDGRVSPKNFVLQTEPQIQEVLGIRKKAHDYYLQTTDARPDTGGLSGATPSEAVSWGKIDPDQLPGTVVCYLDNTVGFPIVAAYALAKRKRSEEHTSELQSQSNLVCRLLLEKKNRKAREDGGAARPRRSTRTASRSW